MASLTEVINWLEKLPDDIKETGKDMVRGSIISHGHYDTGKLFNSVRGSTNGRNVKIQCWSRYASLVNDGHGGATMSGRHAMKFKNSPKWPGPIYAKSVPGYAGSGFFDEAYQQLLSYIQSL